MGGRQRTSIFFDVGKEKRGEERKKERTTKKKRKK